MSNPFKTRVIAEAKIKTDKVDARVLAELLAADYLPSVWQADEATKALRRQVGQHIALVRQRTRVKNQVQAILARNLLPRCPFSDLFGIKGRRWLGDQALPADERRTVRSLLRQLDFAGEELKLVDAELARAALDDPHAPPADDHPRRRHGRGGGHRGHRRRLLPLRVARQARLLCRAQPVGPPVRRAARPPMAGSPSKVGRGRGACWSRRPMRPATPPGPSTLLRAGQSPPGMADRHRRGGPQTAGDLLAHDPRPTRLRLRPAVAGGQENPGARAARRGARPSRTTSRDRRRLQPQNHPGPRTSLGEQAEAAYNHLTRNWQQTRPAGKTQPASPERARQPSVPTPLARPVKAAPAGGSAGLDRPSRPGWSEKVPGHAAKRLILSSVV